MKKLLSKIMLTISLSFAAIGTGFAQQQYQYSQYMLNNLMVNPGAAGSEDYTDLKVGGRFQNISFQGAPSSVFASGHTALGKREHGHDDVKQLPYFGVGGFLQYESTNPINKLQLYASGAFHLPLSAKFTLSAGISMGFQQATVGLSQSDGYQNTSGTQLTDGSLTTQNSFLPDGSVGLWLYSKTLYAGISSRQLFNNQSPSSNIKQIRDYLVTGGYKLKVSPDFDVLPSVLVKFVPGLPVAADVSVRAMYKNFIWVGATYRHQDAIPILLGVNIQDKYTIGVSYDITTSLLNRFSRGTVEVLLGYRLGQSKIAKAPAQFY